MPPDVLFLMPVHVATCRTAGTGQLPAHQTPGLMSWSVHQSVVKRKTVAQAAAHATLGQHLWIPASATL